jgi:hypothetical protein
VYTFFWAILYIGFFFVIKPSRYTNSTNLFCHENLHVSQSSSVHHQEFIHCKLSICSFSTAVYKPVWHIPLLSVQWINSWWWTDELSETCRFLWQNKFVESVHLDGFITKKKPIYRVAQKNVYTLNLILMSKECIHFLGHSVHFTSNHKWISS